MDAVLMGISLSASAGFRAFLPLLAVGLAIRLNGWPEPPLIGWAASDGGLILLGVATILEMAQDKIPFLDNLFDSAETFIKPAAGLLITLGMAHHFSPEAAWALGIAAGAPLAFGGHAAEATLRATSTLFTAGIANPFLSAIEDVAAVAWVVLSFLVPPLMLIVIVLIAFSLVRRAAKKRRLQRRAAPEPPTS